jgi:hypothetical protein
LPSLLTPVEVPDILTRPFEKGEMDLIVKHMAPNKSPSPDGFNRLCLRKCWNIISEDFYNLAKDLKGYAHGKQIISTVNMNKNQDPI